LQHSLKTFNKKILKRNHYEKNSNCLTAYYLNCEHPITDNIATEEYNIHTCKIWLKAA